MWRPVLRLQAWVATHTTWNHIHLWNFHGITMGFGTIVQIGIRVLSLLSNASGGKGRPWLSVSCVGYIQVLEKLWEMCICELRPLAYLTFLLGLGLAVVDSMHLGHGLPPSGIGCRLHTVLLEILLNVNHITWQFDPSEKQLQIIVYLYQWHLGIVWICYVFLGVQIGQQPYLTWRLQGLHANITMKPTLPYTFEDNLLVIQTLIQVLSWMGDAPKTLPTGEYLPYAIIHKCSVGLILKGGQNILPLQSTRNY